MEASIGIMAYNEEKNISNLLQELLKQKLSFVKEIVVVNDGSTDKTAGIVKKFLKNKRIKLINIKKRGGKVSAINHFLKAAKSEILLLESADTIPEKDAIRNLVAEFRNPEIGIVGAQIMPLNKGCDFINFFGQFIYKLHHEISVKNPKFGELIAFRNIIQKLPMTAVDEEYLAMLIKAKDYKLKYCPESIVYNKQPTNIDDIIKQRRRIHAGHLSLKKKSYKVPTTNKMKIALSILKNLSFKNFHHIFIAVLLETWIRILGMYDYYLKKDDHYIWEVAESTKETLITK